MLKYHNELEPILKREQYIDGQHVTQTYASLAHFWLIKQMVKSHKWWINMDDDNSLKTAVLRAFVEEIQDGNAQCFITKVNQKNSKPKAFREHRNNISTLMDWAQIHFGRKEVNLYRAARAMLETQLSSGAYDEDVNINGYVYSRKATKFINHPISYIFLNINRHEYIMDAKGYPWACSNIRDIYSCSIYKGRNQKEYITSVYSFPSSKHLQEVLNNGKVSILYCLFICVCCNLHRNRNIFYKKENTNAFLVYVINQK